MSDDPIQDTEALAKSHGLDFKDCGNGHVQISGMGRLVNYWPMSKKRTAHRNDGHKETNCRPYDAVKLCMTGTKSIKPDKKPSDNGPSFDLKPIKTNLSGLKRFYSGEVPPWDDSLNHPDDPEQNFQFLSSGAKLRHRAYRLEGRAAILRAEAEDRDDER